MRYKSTYTRLQTLLNISQPKIANVKSTSRCISQIALIKFVKKHSEKNEYKYCWLTNFFEF